MSMKANALALASIVSLLVVFSAFAAAESTVEEIEPFMHGVGAQVRVLQMEKTIQRNIIIGEETVKVLAANGNETGVQEGILSQMEALLDEARAINTSNKTQSVMDFVDTKSVAINLSMQFRQSVQGLLTEAMRSEIRNASASRIAEVNRAINQQIRELVRQYNAYRVETALGAFNISRPAVVDGIKNGSITMAQVRSRVVAVLSELAADRKAAAVSAMNRVRTELRANASGELAKSVVGALMRQNEKLRSRLVIANAMISNLRERLNITQAQGNAGARSGRGGAA